jgi:hypothetical protein
MGVLVSSTYKERHKSLQNTNLKITFKKTNTIYNLLRIQQDKKEKYLQSDIYSIKCLPCNQTYAGQTGGYLKLRYHEHI